MVGHPHLLGSLPYGPHPVCVKAKWTPATAHDNAVFPILSCDRMPFLFIQHLIKGLMTVSVEAGSFRKGAAATAPVLPHRYLFIPTMKIDTIDWRPTVSPPNI